VPAPSPRVRLIAIAVGLLAAVALFGTSLAGLAALDGELARAVKGDPRPLSAPASYDGQERDDGACPRDDRRDSRPADRYPS
jgi:hypothetical protein